MGNLRNKPTIFISSTCYDLKQIRADIKEFFERNYGFNAMLSEFDSFPIDPSVGTFENCLSNVDNYADMFLLIVGNRYGYITDKGKSITNLEYLHAKAKGIPIFVFISNQLYNNLPLWRANKDADFSSVVDSPKIFEFIADIYDEAHQWIYTYNGERDIEMTMKSQLALIFSDGLIFKKMLTTPKYNILNADLPVGATRALIEQPYAWEYKFFAHILKNEFDKLQKTKWDLKYGIFEGRATTLDNEELLKDISGKLDEMSKLISIIAVVVNQTFQDAIGQPGEPSNLEMMIYACKRFAALYERLAGWSLYFKSIHADDIFAPLLELLSKYPDSALKTMEDFVLKLYNEITAIPAIEDTVDRKIDLVFSLDESNTAEINAEIERLIPILLAQKVSL